MKIKNLAFCGVMASILGLTGAYAAGDATIIASKAYVDARDNLKQDEDKRVTTTLATYNQTSHTNEQKQADYPSMYTLETAVGAGTSALDGQNADSSTGVSAGAAADNNKVGMPVVKVTETDGIVTSELGAIGTKGISDGAVTYAKVASDSKTTTVSDAASASDAKFPTEKAVRTAINSGDNAITSNFEKGMNADTIEAYNAWAETPNETTAATLTAKITADTGLDNVVSDTRADHANLIPRNSNIQKGIAYMKGNGIVNHTAGVNDTALNSSLTAAANAWKQEFTNSVADDHVPTVAAVEARVKAAESNATGMKDTAASATWDSQNNALTIVTGDNAGNKTDKLATSAQVNTSVSALKSYADYKIGNTAMGTTATTLTGAIAELGTEKLDKNTAITAKNNSIVIYDANGLVTGGTLLEDAAGGLTGVNAETAGNMGCSTTNPCVLTYLGGTGSAAKYRWTAMDTDQLVAQ